MVQAGVSHSEETLETTITLDVKSRSAFFLLPGVSCSLFVLVTMPYNLLLTMPCLLSSSCHDRQELEGKKSLPQAAIFLCLRQAIWPCNISSLSLHPVFVWLTNATGLCSPAAKAPSSKYLTAAVSKFDHAIRALLASIAYEGE